MRLLRWLLLSLPILFLLIFFVVPVWAIFQRALFVDGAFASDQVVRVLSNRGLLGVIRWSAWQALLSTFFTLLIGIPLAYIFARYQFWGKSLLQALVAVPFVLPTVVVALALRALLGSRGLVNTWLMQVLNLDLPPLRLDDTLTLILIAHVFYNLTIVLRLVGGFLAANDPRLEEAAQMLGANRWRVWREVTIPLALPALLAAALLIFTFTFAAFGTVLLLGGVRFRTIEVEIYDQAVNQFNLPVAATLSILQMLITLVLTVAYTRLVQRSTVPQDTRPRSAKSAHTWQARIAISMAVSVIVLLIGTPLVALLVQALRVDGAWSLEYFRLLTVNQRGSFAFVAPWQAMMNSLRFASIATVIALIIGIPAAYLLARPRSKLSRLLDPLFMLPLGTSAVTLGFGAIIAFRSYTIFGFTTPDLRRWMGLLPVAHALLALPFVIRTMLPALRRLNPKLREAASMMGASPLRAWLHVDLPLLMPAFVVSALFAFTISLGDFGAALVLSATNPNTATMPKVIFEFFGKPGAANYGQALAMSSLLMLVTLVSFALIERFRDVSGEF